MEKHRLSQRTPVVADQNFHQSKASFLQRADPSTADVATTIDKLQPVLDKLRGLDPKAGPGVLMIQLPGGWVDNVVGYSTVQYRPHICVEPCFILTSLGNSAILVPGV